MKKNKILLLIMLLFFAGICLWDFKAPVRQFSSQENRKLAQKPTFSVQGMLDKTFMTAYEDYVTDQFPGRDGWISVKTGTEKLSGKKDANGVYFAPKNTLLERHTTESVDLQRAERKVQRLLKEAASLQDATDGNVGVMLIPSASAVQPHRLPAFAAEFDQAAWLDGLKEDVEETGLLYLDSFGKLKEHAREEIYYGTDHHWSTLGAFYGYQAFAEGFGLTAPQLKDYERIAVKTDFWGTLQAKVNLPVAKDVIEIFRRKGERDYPVNFVYENKTAASLYFYEHLETKDAYAFFLDGNHPFLEIEGDGPAKNSILLIKDSYANCFVPFLTEQYGKIYVLDKRFYRGDIAEVMQTYGPKDVLYLYNVFQFMENF